jgi:aminoglycoside phosphotransferase (APT) family kinase protein
MHPDQVDVDADLVRRLVAEQHPQWSDLAVTPVSEFGTDHCLFHLGDALVARMPRIGWAAEQAASDARWLPRLVGHVPVALPVPLALGEPGAGYPFRWSVAPWLPGATPTATNIDPLVLADELAAFVGALHAVDATGGPPRTGGQRGTPIRGWDVAVREAVELAGKRIDGRAALAAWEHCLAAPDHDGDPVWIHGDLLAGNLLVDGGHLSAVIDFGALGVGDPAPDLQPYWSTLPAGAAPGFRQRIDDLCGYDEATWRRGRGWALGPALTGIPYYWDTVPAFAQRGLRTLDRVLADLDLLG